MIIFATVPLTVCILWTVLIRSVQMDRFGPLLLTNPDNNEQPMQDEIDYAPLSNPGDIQDYDWSPPNGEIPDNDYKEADRPLSAYFEDDQDVRESWIDHNNLDSPKSELKRGFDFDYPRKKKNQVLCRVQRAIHHHSEAGHEFFPKSYTSYSCHPVGPAAQVDGSLATSHDVCLMRSNKCSTLRMKRFFLKRNQTNSCWSDIVSMEVGSGCDCLYHYKYRIHL